MNLPPTQSAFTRALCIAVSLLALGAAPATLEAQTVLWAQNFAGSTPQSVNLQGSGFPSGVVFPSAEPPFTPPPFVYEALAYAGPDPAVSNATFSLQSNAVGSQTGLLFTNQGNPVLFAGINAVLGFTVGSPLTLEQVKTWQFSFDYVSNYTTDGLVLNGLQFWSPSSSTRLTAPLNLSSSSPTSYTFNFSSMSDVDLQTFIDTLNPTIDPNGFLSIQFQFGFDGSGPGEITDVGASLGLTNFALTSVPEPTTLGLLGLALLGTAARRKPSFRW